MEGAKGEPYVGRFMAAIPAPIPPRLPPTESVEQRLRRLESQWKAETQFLSDAARITRHQAFQQIIALGPDVVPFLLHDLAAQPPLWVWALPEITGEDPVPESDAGDIRKMSGAWVQWGRENGIP
jgi:hypothetical protein